MIVNADALHIPLANESVQCAITSPPYWGLRDYGVDGQLGLEPTPEEYVANMVRIFREVWRVLKPDGTLWLNLGDSYAGNCSRSSNNGRAGFGKPREGVFTKTGESLKPKDLVGIPWRVAFALQKDGWYLRSDIIWHKPNPIPESVKDRPTKAHEYIFLLSKSARYYYDADAIVEPAAYDGRKDTMMKGSDKYRARVVPGQSEHTFAVRGHERWPMKTADGKRGRNKRSVWTVATRPYKGAHFATFPPDLVEPMVLAGSRPGDIVLDPFAGTATVGQVCIKHHRRFIGLELNPDYIRLALRRTSGVQLVLPAF
jgi:DNA modification methylase